MNIKPDELTEKGYVLLEKLDHNELVPFIRTYINRRTKYSILYYFFNAIAFGLAGYFFVKGFNSPDYDFFSRFTHFSYGLAIALLLLPLHEYIHVLAYKSQGAKNTSYAANFKKFYFMALADKFVANQKEFVIVALAPFVFISTVFTILFFIVPDAWSLTIVSTLLAHTAMCSGDFGLISYFEYNKDRQIVTFDDVELKLSYFYGVADKT